LPDRDFVHAYVTAQMSAKKGLTVFGQQGADALMKELRQLVIMKVMNGAKSHELTKEQKRKALKYLMFLKESVAGASKVAAVPTDANSAFTRQRKRQAHPQSALRLFYSVA
jgi:hypothetical protein